MSVPSSSSREPLTRAVHAVAAALAELREEPASDSVRYQIDAAEQVLGLLDRGLTTTVLTRLLNSIEACHRAGHSDSASLADREQSAVRALRLDPRWNPRIGALRDAG